MSRASLALAFALWRLRLRLNAHNGFWLAAYGVLLPGALSLWAQSRAPDRDFSRHVVVGTFVLGLCSLAAKRTAETVMRERDHGVWNLLATTRVTRNTYLVAHALDVAALIAVPTTGLLIAAFLYPESTARSGMWLLPALLSALTFGALSLLVSGVLPRRIAGVAINALLVASLALCPMLYPNDRVPRAIWPIVRELPPTLATQAMLASWTGSAFPLRELLELLLWGTVAATLVHRVFPWTSPTR